MCIRDRSAADAERAASEVVAADAVGADAAHNAGEVPTLRAPAIGICQWRAADEASFAADDASPAASYASQEGAATVHVCTAGTAVAATECSAEASDALSNTA
eukprot:5655270-Prymnesium_polylepis.1